MNCLEDITGLRYQEVPQQRRCSFFASSERNIEKVRSAVLELDCEVIYSAKKFLDVLPKGVNKGSSLTKLVEFLGINPARVLVAGDTLNDLAMYRCRFKGVVVGSAEDKLVAAVQRIPDSYCAEAAGAGGILEGLLHFPEFSGGKNTIQVQSSDEVQNQSPQQLMMYHRFPYEMVQVNGLLEADRKLI